MATATRPAMEDLRAALEGRAPEGPAQSEVARQRERRPSFVTLGFAAIFLAAFVTPPLVPQAFAPYPLLRWGDVVDMVTPIAMAPAYWMLLRTTGARPRTWEIVLFVALLAAWVEGQAMHLAANSIGHQLSGGPAGTLGHFFDERLSHVLWHGAALALSALIVVRVTPEHRPDGRVCAALAGLAGLVYGFAFFLIAVEGTTSILAATGGVLIMVLALRHGPRVLLSNPLLELFGIGYATMLVLLGAWFVMWGGSLPEFSSLGLIK